MPASITQHIHVQVRAEFVAPQSDPRAARFIFAYRISITNAGQRGVQLLRRHWHIVDSLGPSREVEGEGVVGETPELAPGETYTYGNFCELRSGFGRMHGTYLMRHVDDDSLFKVRIPRFDLLYPYNAN